MVKISSVERFSRAERVGILPNDILVSINGNEIEDVLDYRFYLTEKEVTITVKRNENFLDFKVKKEEYDDIGLDFETPLMDKKHSCKNGCIFCFIDQNPKGLRETLYFKDDDSRLSFIHGNYITLTNLTDKDIKRIVKMRFSPINISIHTTNPDLRVQMMKNKRSGEVLRYLSDFRDAGLSMCGQIVLCRGINDSDELRRTLSDLSKYYPSMSSVAIVPAGLTKYRDKLYPLTDFTAIEAGEVVDLINEFGEAHKKEYGTRLFYAADEFYLKAGREVPSSEYYEDYPQLENGVGMIRAFIDEYGMALSDVLDSFKNKNVERRISIATGVSAYPFIKELVDKIQKICPNLTINIYKIINNFFGESITVSGLLTGIDLKNQLKDKELYDELLIPENSLRHGEEVFLCGMTVQELSSALGVKVTPSGSDGYELVEKILSEHL